jgi:hypothetical protein
LEWECWERDEVGVREFESRDMRDILRIIMGLNMQLLKGVERKFKINTSR